ncbi:MAG: hemolysin XhlA family protein [Clostridium sp.]|uniref:hemolysin XhlA family protein n=1 Tax=Clostridium TaxID=1485 RepID=UPI002902D877|nr:MULTISPECIES: hemolysin XhlA family protein [Clostridium]MDU2683489.1 hemolysin XhlA family protein [Clostridium sp.]MDY4605250.1 hemolysin XhlA family protein [Clostridium tertium]
MNDELIKHQLEIHDKRLNNHGKRLDELERGRAATDVKMDNLCEKLEAQTKSINWLIGIMASSLLGFFFYAIQNGIFK